MNEPRRSALVWLASVDHGRRDALVALDGDEIVAVARYDSRPGDSAAEVAVTVEDAWQHQGIGGRLTKRLARRAVDHGIDRSSPPCWPTTGPRSGFAQALSRRVGAFRRRRLRGVDAAPPLQLNVGYRQPAVGCRAVGEAVDESQARPRVVDRAHLVVDEPVREPDLAHDALAEVGRDTAVRLGHAIQGRPRNRLRARERVEASFQLGEDAREEQHDIVLAARLMAQSRAIGHRVQRALETLGRARECDAPAGFDAELLRSAVPE